MNKRIVLDNNAYYDNRGLVSSYSVIKGCVYVKFTTGEKGWGIAGNNQHKLQIPVTDSKFQYTFFSDPKKGTVKRWVK